MKKIVLSTFFLTVYVISPRLVYAGGGHDHGHEHNHEAAVEPAPHGGVLRDSPPYKTELVLNNDQAKIYIYDKDLKIIPKDKLAPTAVGQLGFPKDRTKREVVFKLAEDHYEANIPGIGAVHRYDLHVTLTVSGKSILGDFGVDNIH